jgi:ketosteroid isomerase-like protein
MSHPAEQLEQHPLIETVRRYLHACSSADADGVAACCTTDVVHYFLVPGMHPVRGNELLGSYRREAVRLISAEWRVEHAIACEDEAVIEWSMQWTSRDDGERYIVHGTEWSAFRDGLIAEIRAYYDHAWPTPRNEDTGLVDFPYAERGHTMLERTPRTTSRARVPRAHSAIAE